MRVTRYWRVPVHQVTVPVEYDIAEVVERSWKGDTVIRSSPRELCLSHHRNGWERARKVWCGGTDNGNWLVGGPTEANAGLRDGREQLLREVPWL
jgi:hypothetical protein